jgi:hypothetical protein
VSQRVYLTKYVVAVRSARQKHWVATIAGSSMYHSDRMMGMLYQTVASADYSARMPVFVDMKRLQSKGEETAS